MQVRTATPADIAAIRAVAHTTWPVAYAEILSPPQLAYMLDLMYSEAALQAQFSKGHVFLLALEGGRAVGFGSYETHYEQRPSTRVHKLYVLPDQQGKGTGLAILDRIRAAAVEAGDATLNLNVNRFNKAVAFYRRHGFTVARDMVLDIGQGYVMDDHVMELQLQ